MPNRGPPWRVVAGQTPGMFPIGAFKRISNPVFLRKKLCVCQHRPNASLAITYLSFDRTKSDVYKNDADLCVDSPPSLLLAICAISIEWLWKSSEKRGFFASFSQRLDEYRSYRYRKSEANMHRSATFSTRHFWCDKY